MATMMHRGRKLRNTVSIPWQARQRRGALRSAKHFRELQTCLCFSDMNRTDMAAGVFYDEAIFQEMLSTERKRTERSGRPFLFLFIDFSRLLEMDPHTEGFSTEEKVDAIQEIYLSICETTREIDIKGWYRQGTVMGLICTEVDQEHHGLVNHKIRQELRKKAGKRYASLIEVGWSSFPLIDESTIQTREISYRGLFINMYESPISIQRAQRMQLFLKRSMDLVGSLCAIALFSPFFLLIPLLIKATSKGPVFFRQQRIGRGGKAFTFLKFRSMKTDSDDSIHRDFVSRLIKGEIDSETGEEKDAFKIKNDPRVTLIGRIIRKTSLDELPQLFNVLRGDMSLVGPRPPIPYEVDQYLIWHKRRVFEVKPGITGFWQIEGRSSTNFETMVRMDINYIKNWSFYLDVKLLLKTPFAVLQAKGAC